MSSPLKSCESAKGILELYKNGNWMELGEENKLIKSFHWQNHCYRDFRWIMYLGFLIPTGQLSSRGFAGSGEWTEVGFVTDIQDSKPEPFRMSWGGKHLGIPGSRHLLALMQHLCSLLHNQGYKVGMPCEERLSFDYLLGF